MQNKVLLTSLLALFLSACSTPAKIETANVPAVSPPAAKINSAETDLKLNIQFDWWRLLHSPQLNALIEQTFYANPTLEAAQSNLLKSQQNKTELAGAKFIGEIYLDFSTPKFSVGYLPEMLYTNSTTEASPELKQLQLEATYLTLATNAIAVILKESSLRAQMAVSRKIVALDQSLLAISRKRLKAGLLKQSEVQAQQEALRQSAQKLDTLKTDFEQTRAQLYLLLGLPAGYEIPDAVAFSALTLSETLPLELPVSLMAQRPDMRAAQLENRTTEANYQTASVQAQKNVEDTLLAIYNAALELKTATSEAENGSATLEQTRQQYNLKKVDYVDLLIADKNSLSATLFFIQTQTYHLEVAIALYHALGSAWWKATSPVNLEFSSELKGFR